MLVLLQQFFVQGAKVPRMPRAPLNPAEALLLSMVRYTLELFVQPLCLVECARGLLFHRHRRIESVLRERHAECAFVRFGEEKWQQVQ